MTGIQADLRRGDMAAAKEDWLNAQLGWERVGASYDSFGDIGLAVDGLPDGLPDGVNDKNFTGLHRLEYGLWHGQSAATLRPVAATLASNVAAVQHNLTSADLAGDPTNLPVRAHEILEDALRDHLSGLDDQGGGAAFVQTYADVDITRAVLAYLAPLINARQPGLPGHSRRPAGHPEVRTARDPRQRPVGVACHRLPRGARARGCGHRCGARDTRRRSGSPRSSPGPLKPSRRSLTRQRSNPA